MNGLEVAKRIRQECTLKDKDIVLIAMTGHGDHEDRQRSFEAGFDYHLVKPADIVIVHEILATVKMNLTNEIPTAIIQHGFASTYSFAETAGHSFRPFVVHSDWPPNRLFMTL